MKLKTLPLLLLLTALPTLTLSAQNTSESPPAHNNDYGIDAGKLYEGTLVLELLREAEAEIEAAAREGYEAGYKAALLAEAPNAAYYKALSENLKRELERAEKLNAERTKEIRAGALAQIFCSRYTILMLKIRLTENAAPPHGRGCYPAARKAPWGSLQSKLQAENPPWKADFQPLTAHDYTLLKRRRVKSPIGNNPFSFPNKQFSQKYTAFSFQNGSFSFQNAAFSLDNAVFSFQNAAFSLANAVFSFQNGSFSLENNAFSFQNKSFSLDNAEFSLAHSAFSCLNTAFLKDKTIIAYGPAVRRRLLA